MGFLPESAALANLAFFRRRSGSEGLLIVSFEDRGAGIAGGVAYHDGGCVETFLWSFRRGLLPFLNCTADRMAKTSKISLKASLSSHQSRLQAKQKAAHAAHLAEQRAKKAATGYQKSKGKARAQAPRCTLPFTPRDRILLIGEGNFSFARSLIGDPPSPLLDLSASNITATTLDSEEDCYAKYPDAKLIVSLLRSKGVEVHFEVDATKLEKKATLRGRRWDRVVWNFPHAGEQL